MNICDWFKKKPREYVVRVENAADLKRSTFDEAFKQFCPPFEGNPADCAFKKPDTVESVLNQFIALGLDKPVVVINGITRQDGAERWNATIDGEPVGFEHFSWAGHLVTTHIVETLLTLEKRVIEILKDNLSKIVVSETIITY